MTAYLHNNDLSAGARDIRFNVLLQKIAPLVVDIYGMNHVEKERLLNALSRNPKSGIIDVSLFVSMWSYWHSSSVSGTVAVPVESAMKSDSVKSIHHICHQIELELPNLLFIFKNFSFRNLVQGKVRDAPGRRDIAGSNTETLKNMFQIADIRLTMAELRSVELAFFHCGVISNVLGTTFPVVNFPLLLSVVEHFSQHEHETMRNSTAPRHLHQNVSSVKAPYYFDKNIAVDSAVSSAGLPSIAAPDHCLDSLMRQPLPNPHRKPVSQHTNTSEFRHFHVITSPSTATQHQQGSRNYDHSINEANRNSNTVSFLRMRIGNLPLESLTCFLSHLKSNSDGSWMSSEGIDNRLLQTISRAQFTIALDSVGIRFKNSNDMDEVWYELRQWYNYGSQNGSLKATAQPDMGSCCSIASLLRWLNIDVSLWSSMLNTAQCFDNETGQTKPHPIAVPDHNEDLAKCMDSKHNEKFEAENMHHSNATINNLNNQNPYYEDMLYPANESHVESLTDVTSAVVPGVMDSVSSEDASPLLSQQQQHQRRSTIGQYQQKGSAMMQLLADDTQQVVHSIDTSRLGGYSKQGYNFFSGECHGNGVENDDGLSPCNRRKHSSRVEDISAQLSKVSQDTSHNQGGRVGSTTTLEEEKRIAIESLNEKRHLIGATFRRLLGVGRGNQGAIDNLNGVESRNVKALDFADALLYPPFSLFSSVPASSSLPPAVLIWQLVCDMVSQSYNTPPHLALVEFRDVIYFLDEYRNWKNRTSAKDGAVAELNMEEIQSVSNSELSYKESRIMRSIRRKLLDSSQVGGNRLRLLALTGSIRQRLKSLLARGGKGVSTVSWEGKPDFCSIRECMHLLSSIDVCVTEEEAKGMAVMLLREEQKKGDSCDSDATISHPTQELGVRLGSVILWLSGLLVNET